MVFVGSRRDLSQISTDFKDTWITFIRSFNHLKPDFSVLKENARLIDILLNLVVRKNKQIREKNVRVVVLTALGEDLKQLKIRMATLIDDQAHLRVFDFAARKKQLKHDIKHIKKNIALTAAVLREYETVDTMSPKQQDRRNFLLKSKKAILTALVAGSVITAPVYAGLLALAQRLPLNKKEGLAILISTSTNKWFEEAFSKFSPVISPAYVARVEIAFGQRANVVKLGATSDDLFAVLRDDAIQHVVIFGHGSWISWQATDRTVYASELEDSKFKRKEGYLVRHTCGEERETKTVRAFVLDEEKWEQIQALVSEINRRLPRKYILTVSCLYYSVLDRLGCEIILFFDRSYSRYSGKGLKSSVFSEAKEVPDADNALKPWSEVRHLFKRDQALLVQWTQVLTAIKEILSLKREYAMDQNLLFGMPIFQRGNIKGWDRVTDPWDFLINVFGDEKLDQMYVEK